MKLLILYSCMMLARASLISYQRPLFVENKHILYMKRKSESLRRSISRELHHGLHRDILPPVHMKGNSYHSKAHLLASAVDLDVSSEQTKIPAELPKYAYGIVWMLELVGIGLGNYLITLPIGFLFGGIGRAFKLSRGKIEGVSGFRPSLNSITANGWDTAKTFGFLSATFGVTSKIVKTIMGESFYSDFIIGFVVGGIIVRDQGPVAMVNNGVTFGLFSAILKTIGTKKPEEEEKNDKIGESISVPSDKEGSSSSTETMAPTEA